MKRYFWIIFCILTSACIAWPRATRPVIKIGLVAPFEGRDRPLGYEVLGAVKEAVARRNAAGGVGGYMVELVALNDNNIADESAFQAREFAVDHDVLGVIGPFSEAALAAAAPLYDEFGLPLIAPVAADGQPHSAVFSLAATPDELALALIESLPHENDPLLVDGGTALGSALRPFARHVVNAPVDPGGLVRHLHTFGEQQPGPILFDGDALTAAELLVALRAEGFEQSLWGGPALARPYLLQIAGPAAQNVCYVVAAPADSPSSSTSPTPWADLAREAADLLLNTLETVIQTQRTPSRQAVLARLQTTFEAYRRERIVARVYCY